MSKRPKAASVTRSEQRASVVIQFSRLREQWPLQTDLPGCLVRAGWIAIGVAILTACWTGRTQLGYAAVPVAMPWWWPFSLGLGVLGALSLVAARIAARATILLEKDRIVVRDSLISRPREIRLTGKPRLRLTRRHVGRGFFRQYRRRVNYDIERWALLLDEAEVEVLINGEPALQTVASWVAQFYGEERPHVSHG